MDRQKEKHILYLSMYINKEIYYKELMHIIVGAESQVIQLARRKPRKS